MFDTTTEIDPAEMTKEQLDAWRMSDLPETMKAAQLAVENPEVQEMIRRLAAYNLGVCMPHMHVKQGEFRELPSGMIALERQTDFIAVSESDPLNALPVAWRWNNGTVEAVGSCHIKQRKCDG